MDIRDLSPVAWAAAAEQAVMGPAREMRDRDAYAEPRVARRCTTEVALAVSVPSPAPMRN